MTDLHTRMMQRAIDLARQAEQQGELPVGAVIYTQDGQIIGEGFNQTESLKDPTQHAEMIALKHALLHTGEKYLNNAYLAVTLEPCAMCAQALSYARIHTIYFGAADIKSGGTLNGARVLEHAHHKPIIIDGFMEKETKSLLPEFFQKKR